MITLSHKACLFVVGVFCCAQALHAGPKPGFLFYVPDYGVSARMLEFTDFGDYKKEGFFVPITTKDGQLLKVQQDFIFDVNYLPEIFPENIQTADDITKLDSKIKQLSDLQKKYPRYSENLGAYIEQIKDETTSFKGGKRKIDGKWLSPADVAAIELKRQSAPREDEGRKVSTRDGKMYSGVTSLEVRDHVVVVIYKSGIVNIPLDNISDETLNLNPKVKAAYDKLKQELDAEKNP
ncbi:MAG: hypothetical protein PHD76_02675 [Methylacidiphilales bacterium]|nr:hypothetical protein [Candidatus Methylacidiphilales bacterium]